MHPVGLLALALCLGGLYLRVLNARTDLGSPSVDENDVVQQAVAFMSGEWRYYLPEYGALPMYLLALVYHLVARVHGWSGFEYAKRVFFDADEHYFIARLSCAACYALLALLSHRFLAPRFGRSAALVSAGLLALPGLDALTSGTIRIDVMQGTWQLLALLGLCKALESQQLRYWLWAGAAAGLGIATKPLPGLLLAPCFLAASWFAAEATGAEGAPWWRRFGQRLRPTLLRPGLWLSALTLLVVGLLANPSALDLPAFVRAQREATQFYSGPKAPGAQLSVFQAATYLEVSFLSAAGVSVVILAFARDARARLIALFPLVYASAFWGRPVRQYYLVAPAMALCLTIGIAFGLVLCRFGLDAPSGAMPPSPPSRRAWFAPRRWVGYAAAGAFVAYAAYAPALRLDQARRSLSHVTQARAWIERNIPSGTGIFQYGTYAGGPRLVASGAQRQHDLGDYFDYGRRRYDFYRRAYFEAYADYVRSGRPHYALDMYKYRPEPVTTGKVPRWVANRLDQRAARDGQQYIVLGSYKGVGGVEELGYSWLPRVELVQQFGSIVIFRVPTPNTPAPVVPPAAAPGPAVSSAAAAPQL